jgi:hypothetical protein
MAQHRTTMGIFAEIIAHFSPLLYELHAHLCNNEYLSSNTINTKQSHTMDLLCVVSAEYPLASAGLQGHSQTVLTMIPYDIYSGSERMQKNLRLSVAWHV